MSTDTQRAKWRKNFLSRRAERLAGGAKQLNIILEMEAATALDLLIGTRAGSTYTDVVSKLLVRDAARRHLKLRQAPTRGRSK